MAPALRSRAFPSRFLQTATRQSRVARETTAGLARSGSLRGIERATGVSKGISWSAPARSMLGDLAYPFNGAQQGASVALSSDGNTAVEGGYNDNGGMGAVWVFTRDSNGNWSQQGSKLVGTGGIGTVVWQGVAVSLSGDGNTALSGASSDDGGFTQSAGGKGVGAFWAFTRDSDGNWTQLGNKLVGSGLTGPQYQGRAIAISADGNTALEGGNGAQAVWPFARPSACAADVSTQVTVTRGGLRYDHSTKMFVQTVTVTNLGPPISDASLVVTGLSSNATVSDAGGLTKCVAPLGSPWISISKSVAEGQSASVTLTLSDPTLQGIQYTTRVLAGSGQQ